MAFNKKSSVIDGIPVYNDFEEDSLTIPLDAQNTTIGGALRLMIKDKYTPKEPLDKLQQGMVVKEITNPNDFEYTQKNELETQNREDLVPIRYKVYLMSTTGQLFPEPEDFDDATISSLDDFSVSPKFEGALSVGMIVFVDAKKRIIEFAAQQNINESASEKETKGAKKPSETYKNPMQQNKGPINLDKIPQDFIEAEAYSTVRVNGEKKLKKEKIRLKPIVSYDSQRMRADAADKFNELCRAAAKDDVKIVGTSGFRDMQTQIKLYNDRYVHPYPRKPSENTLSPNGKRIGVAAYPGYSNHQGGIAVDIDIGPHLAEKNRYAGDMGKDPAFVWMTKNAEKFGFDNREGKSVNEPWHWVYNRPPPESSKAAEEGKDGADGGK